MSNKDLSLGIDTSNYKTSLSVTDSKGNILFNHQQFLKVKEGERGLRQSEAFFQHVQTLPDVIQEVMSHSDIREKIGVISVSSRPRPVEGSYMPCFTAGVGFAKSLSAALNVPYYEFSHQEGHIEAVQHFSSLKDKDKLICFHFSGGTTEAIYCDHSQGIYQIIGGSKDLAYGQVLDRIGVKLGYAFPCGEALDKIAMETVESFHDFSERKAGKVYKSGTANLKQIKVNDCYVNLSGIETQAQRLLDSVPENELVLEIFEKLSKSVLGICNDIEKKYGINKMIFAGGVSSSSFMRSYLKDTMPKSIEYCFGAPELSSDNAVGISLLGGRRIWL